MLDLKTAMHTSYNQNTKGGNLQDGRGIRCGDHLLHTDTSKIHLHVEQLLQNTY